MQLNSSSGYFANRN